MAAPAPARLCHPCLTARAGHHRRWATDGGVMPVSASPQCLFGIPSIDAGATRTADVQCGPALDVTSPRGRGRRLAALARGGPALPDSPPPLARRRLTTAAWRLNSQIRGVRQRPDRHPTGRADDRHRRDGAGQRGRVGVHRPGQRVVRLRPGTVTSRDVDRLERAVALYAGPARARGRRRWVLGERARVENLYLVALSHPCATTARSATSSVARCGELRSRSSRCARTSTGR